MKGGDVDREMVEPRRKEPFVSNRYGAMTRGCKQKKAMAKKCKKMGAKAKTGKEPEQVNPVSSQLGIMNYFSTRARPEEIGTPLGIGPYLQIPAIIM